MTAQDLKNSILQLAVEGKLVPQDRRDCSINELVSALKARRRNLVENNLIKIDKKHTAEPFSDADVPFEIPNTWRWVKLADIVYFSSGKTPARQDVKSWSQVEVPWVSISDMEDGGTTISTAEKISQYALKEYFSDSLVPKGTIIMSFKLTIGKISYLGIDAVHNEAIISIFPYATGETERILKEYLFKVLPLIANGGDFKNAVKGKTLNATSISNLFVPLPPLEEQKRIVAKIEELLPYIEEYGKAEGELSILNEEFHDKLRRSILQLAVQGKLVPQNDSDEPAGELVKRIRHERALLQKNRLAKKSQAADNLADDEIPFKIPQNWEWVNLGWLCMKIGAGSTPKGGRAVYKKQGVKFLREQNVHDDGLHLQDVVFIDEIIHVSKSGSQVQAQDILMNITGGSIGRNALVPDDFDTANINQHILIIRLVDKALRFYLHYCLSAPVVLNQMFSKQVGDKPGLSAYKVENFLIPLPPLDEQTRIVARVEELLAICDGLK